MNSSSALTKQPLVLIVDDDEATRVLLRLTIGRVGMNAMEATDGTSAIRIALHDRPDLIVMDMRMPGLSGFDTIERLRAEPATRRIPIIGLTAAARTANDAVRGLQIGADDYVHKPFSPDELVARIRSRIAARKVEERLQQRTDELEALVRIGAQLNEALALEDLVDRLLSISLAQLPALAAAIFLNDAGDHAALFRFRAMDNGLDVHPGADQLQAPDTLLGQTLLNSEARLVADAESSQSGEHLTILPGLDCRSGIAVPLVHHGKVLGAVLIADRHVARFTESDLWVLRSIGEQAALAVRNVQLYEELGRYARDLEARVETRTIALREANERLRRAEKLAALGTLAAGIAHEVNNPLQPVLTSLEMTIESLDEGQPPDRELLEVAEREVRRIQRLVARLLGFARPDRQGMVALDLNSLVGEVLALASKQLQHSHVAVETDLTVIPTVSGNTDQLKQVMLNLVINAMQAMPDGGTLTIRTFRRSSNVGLSVTDTGYGIAPDDLQRIFDPFFTTKSDGTGLGLAVSYQIIEAHGGQIEVQSHLGTGTEFTIWLPVMQPG